MRAMTLARARRVLTHPLAVALLVLVFATVLLEGGSVAHTHLGTEAGYYNHDHDLSLLATRSAAGPLPDVAPAFFIVIVVALVIVATAVAPDPAPGRHADVRAPPAR